MIKTIESKNQTYAELQAWGECVNHTLINLDFSAKDSCFSGSYHYMSTKDFVAARLFGSPHRTTRPPRRLREVASDFVLLIYLKAGDTRVSHRRFDGMVNQGSFIVLDSDKPHDLAMDDRFDHLVLRMSKARFVALHPAASLMLDQPVAGDTAEAKAAAGVLEMIVSLGGATSSTIATMSETVVKLLGDRLAYDPGRPMGRDFRHSLLAGRILKSLDGGFADPTYSATRLAEEIGISRRYVDSIFAEMNSSFGKMLLEKRLARCHALLSDAHYRGRSITDIAFESGFNDLSHFSKRFRERYGTTPRSLRSAEE